jgi:hypothetical protein
VYILLKFKFNVNKFLITRIYPVRKRTAFLFLLNVHYFNGVQLTPTNLFLFIQRKRISDLYDAHILQIKTLSFFFSRNSRYSIPLDISFFRDLPSKCSHLEKENVC